MTALRNVGMEEDRVRDTRNHRNATFVFAKTLPRDQTALKYPTCDLVLPYNLCSHLRRSDQPSLHLTDPVTKQVGQQLTNIVTFVTPLDH